MAFGYKLKIRPFLLVSYIILLVRVVVCCLVSIHIACESSVCCNVASGGSKPASEIQRTTLKYHHIVNTAYCLKTINRMVNTTVVIDLRL